jgi:hypothetical protein
MHRPPIVTCFKLRRPINSEKLKSSTHHAMNAGKIFPNCISNTTLSLHDSLTARMDRCLLFIPKHMGEPLTNTKKGYRATYTNSCGLRLRSRKQIYKILHSGEVFLRLGFPCSLLLHARSPGYIPGLVWHADALLRGEERLVSWGVKGKASVL